MKVVLYTAKVRFFKQITTHLTTEVKPFQLFCIPQRCDFSSKSQPKAIIPLSEYRCFVYRKGAIFQANHNSKRQLSPHHAVVLYTAKVRFFKQITTCKVVNIERTKLFCIPQRCDFSSKSQHIC